MFSSFRSIALQVVLLAVLLFAVHSWQTRHLLPAESKSPQFMLPALSGGLEPLWKPNTTTLLYVWAPWCSICRYSINNLNAIEEDYSQQQVRVITLVQDYQNLNEVRQFQRDTELGQKVLLGNPHSIQRLRISAYPTYYLIDGDGTILSRSVGYSSQAGLKIRSWLYQHKAL